MREVKILDIKVFFSHLKSQKVFLQDFPRLNRLFNFWGSNVATCRHFRGFPVHAVCTTTTSEIERERERGVCVTERQRDKWACNKEREREREEKCVFEREIDKKRKRESNKSVCNKERDREVRAWQRERQHQQQQHQKIGFLLKYLSRPLIGRDNHLFFHRNRRIISLVFKKQETGRSNVNGI